MNQRGFTLIELIVVIVILGILSATALPKFVDLGGDAEDSALKGVVGSVNSAYSMNYANRLIDATRGVSISGATTATVCDPITSQLIGGKLPDNYGITLKTGSSCTSAGSTALCTVSFKTKTADAIAVCTG